MRRITKTICKKCLGDNKYEAATIQLSKGFCLLCGVNLTADNAVTLRGSSFDILYEQGLLKNTLPTNLQQCLDELDKMLSDEEKENIKNIREPGYLHRGLGMFLRNKWGLWAGSELAKWFTKHDIMHPDNMSSVILRAYYQKLNNKPFNDDRYLSELPKILETLNTEE